MTSSTVNSLLATTITTAWDYLSTVLTVILPFAIGAGLLFFGIRFILSRVRGR